jgi:hypothetical protein
MPLLLVQLVLLNTHSEPCINPHQTLPNRKLFFRQPTWPTKPNSAHNSQNYHARTKIKRRLNKTSTSDPSCLSKRRGHRIWRQSRASSSPAYPLSAKPQPLKSMRDTDILTSRRTVSPSPTAAFKHRVSSIRTTAFESPQ